MIRILLPFVILLLHLSSGAQQLQLSKQALIAVKQIDEHGFLLIAKGKGKQGIILRRVGLDLQLRWETEVEVAKLSGYQFNKAYVEVEKESLVFASMSAEKTIIIRLNIHDGSVLGRQEIPIQLQTEGNYQLMVSGQNTLMVKEGSRRWLNISSEGEIAEDSLQVSIGKDMRFGWVDEQDDQLYSYRYKASKDHRIIHLDLRKDGLEDRAKEERYYELELSFSSFTFNSTVDDRLMYFSAQGDHFYAIGKLDHAFTGNYPQTKLSEGFIGFWIAKFDRNLELIYFNEIPFQFFEGMISKDVISQAAVMDIKEDLYGSVLLSIHEMRGVIYHNKYVITLDKEGKHQGLVGGRDQYNFFEYNHQGLRECATKSKLRLMNDDWSYYATSSLGQMAYIPDHHSPMIAELRKRAANSPATLDELSYNFFSWKDRYYLLEYREQGKGKLSIELIPH